SRLAEKAMLLLSGDHATSPSDPLVNVICRGSALPSFGTIQRSDDCSFSSYDGLVTEKTVHLPSGLGAGPPTRFISHIVSCVSARLDGILMFCAASDAAASARRTVIERICRSIGTLWRNGRRPSSPAPPAGSARTSRVSSRATASR